MTFANRWRVLQQQMIQFGSTVGTIFINAFKPVLRVLNRVMDAAIQFAETVLNALGAIFGWTYEISAAGISDDLGFGEMATDMGDIASGAGDTASGLGNAAKNAAKLKTQLQSFDRLNNLSSPNESGSGGSGGSGGGGGGGGGGASGGSGAISIARHTGEGIIKAYESAIDSLHGLGEYISTSLRDALRNIDWDSIYLQARSFGTGLASFLNGLIRPDTFYEVGKTIANSLNTAMEFAFGLGDVFSFKNAGESLNRGLKGFFENFNWDLVKSTVNVWLEGLAQFINNAITPDLFGDIGDFIGNAITTAFTGMKTFFINLDGANIGVSLGEGFNHMISGIDPHEIASAINEALKDAKDAAVELVKTIHWDEVWEDAKTILSELDIPLVQIVIGYIGLKTAATVVKEAGKALFLKKALQWLGVTQGSTAAVSATSGTLGEIVGNALSIAIPLSVMLSPFVVLGKFLSDEDYKKAIEDSGISSVDAMSSLTPDDATKTKSYELGKTIGEKFAEGFNYMVKNTVAYKIYTKLIATDLEDKIPLEAKVVKDGKVQSTSMDTTGIPAPQKRVTGVEALANDLNTTGLPGDKKKVFGMLAVANNFKDNIAKGSKNVNNVTANASSMKDKVKSKALYNVLAYTKELKKQNGFRAFKLTGKLASSNGKYVLQMARSGGVFEDGKRHKIPQFADGGVPFPVHGSMFIAGEAGPELVGHVGGRTEVLNASQIAVAVSDGVARANNSVVNALAAQNRILVGILEKKTGISSKDIFSAVRAEAANYQLRTGTPAFQ